jgi:IS30 family transposase
MVELLGCYSNSSHLLDLLSNMLNAPNREEADPARKPRQRQTRLDLVDQEKLIAVYQAGSSVYDLAEQFVLTRQTVSAILERHGIKRRYKLLSADDVESAKRLYEAGASYATIGEFLKVNPSTVRKSLLGAGVESRPVGTNQWNRSP